MSELDFETALWRQLSRFDALSREHFAWDPGTNPDPMSPNFGFSFAGHAFFVVGLHPNSSRKSRAFAHPALVFNPQSQFADLRESGLMQRMKTVIRSRELTRSGSLNPMLADFGQTSEAQQYSGRAVPSDWVCPFRNDGHDT